MLISHKQATQENCQVFTQLRNVPSIGSKNSEDETSIFSPHMHNDDTDDCFLPTTPNELSETLPINSLCLQPPSPLISDIISSQTKTPAQIVKHLQEQECNSQLQSLDNFIESNDQLLQYDNNGSQQFQCPSQSSKSSGFQCQNLSPEIEKNLCDDAQPSKANFFTLDRSFLTLDVAMFSDLDIIGQEKPLYQQNKIKHKPEQQQQSQETQQNKEQHQVDFCGEPQREKVHIVNIKVHI